MPNEIIHSNNKNVTMKDCIDSTIKNDSISNEAKTEKETIHSGQFMVSHFEAEEAMDDLDDGEVKMLDPEDPSLLKQDEPNACMQMQLYVPRNTCLIKKADNSMAGFATSHLEIETSLTKLFNCMNLAYSQKLTSPKWNHFKGVRLRWKDKIRLNNVIWRCWHMQFILKRKTPVCQFASPLDVDVHSNPQSVVLEGKYWKRQLAVIKAEYRKWRRNNISKTTGCLSYDSKSEFDFLEWSPINERTFFPSDEWTSDILFSSINVPFPFPDPREIARGAGIADFIQPSLGPLQPNLDDIDLTFADLLQNSRLPPVPEEVSDDMLKNVEYAFSAIMGPDQMDSSTNMEVVSNSNNQSNDDANMIELNHPLNSQQFNDVGQQFVSRGIHFLSESNENSEVGAGDTVMMDHRVNTPQPLSASTKHFGSMNDTFYNRNAHEFSGKSVIKGRISKNLQRPFRRELHNYDRAQPTPHQTTVYQQMLAEQQKQDNSQLLSHNLNIQQHKSITFQECHKMQYAPPQNTTTSSPIITNSRHRSSENSRLVNIDNSSSLYSMPLSNNNYFKKCGFSEYMTNLTAQKPSTSLPMILKDKLEPIFSDRLSMLKSTCEIYGNKTHSSEDPIGPTSYKPAQLIKKCAVNESYSRIRSTDDIQDQSQTQSKTQINSQAFPLSLNSLYSSPVAPSLSTSSQQKHQQKKKVATQKEMFRSNSLPLYVSLQRMNHDNFVAPNYHVKSNKSRSRSNSIHQHSTANHLVNTVQLPKQIQPASSDPLLHSTLAQLLTTDPKISLGSQSCSSHKDSSTFNVPLSKSEFRSTKDSITTLNSSSISREISNTQHQESTQPKLQELQVTVKSVSIPMSAATIMHGPRESKVQSDPRTCGKSHSISSESFLDKKLVLSADQNQMISTDNQRRAGHIHAEQKRRYNIKNGFDMLHSLIPYLQQNSNSKLSKAAMLQKGAEHIKYLRADSKVLNETIKKLREERDALNNSLSHLHTILPANGAPLSRQGTEHVMQLYEQYVRYRTLSNWKFWILGLILEPLLTTFTPSVSSASMGEMRRSAYLWIDQHCSLIDLRPAVSNKLKYLSMNTDILSDPPSTLQEEVKKAINSSSGQHPNLHG